MGLQPIDPFELLGIPARFDLDKAQLEARQRELSKVLHPDRFATTGSADRRAALNKAMSVNEAVRLLKNPVARGYALLARILGPHASGELEQARVPPRLLMDIMEWREELANALARRDKAEVARISQLAADRRGATSHQLTTKFEALAVKRAAGAAADWQADAAEIAQELATLKYFERLAEEVRRLEDELADA